MTNDERRKIYEDYLNVIVNSWTFAKLTEAEQIKVYELFNRFILTGTKQQLRENLHTLYMAFLYGTGYSWNGWRDDK